MPGQTYYQKELGINVWKRRPGEPAIKSTPEESRKLISLILEKGENNS